MGSPRLPQPRTSSALAVLGKRFIAALVLLAVGLLAVKFLAGIVIGLITTVLTVVAVVALVIAGLWAYRRL
ncbi:MAG: hypothetical protein M3P50_01130 [Actinomycetota bacterium]|nr:hypothetical protein [Actinomycetota bacterium]